LVSALVPITTTTNISTDDYLLDETTGTISWLSDCIGPTQCFGICYARHHHLHGAKTANQKFLGVINLVKLLNQISIVNAISDGQRKREC
jgi:hypothetical protein